MEPPRSVAGDRVLTVPNALSALRLILVPVFLYLLLVVHEAAWAVAILVFSGFSDWADGKIARLVANQSSKLGALLDPAVDRIYMIAVPMALAVANIVPWWIVLTLIARDAVLAATLPILRSRGLTALPVAYLGKAATFALMSGFPLILLGQWDALWSRVILACGWAFLIWGMAMYLWSGLLYLIQVRMVLALPRTGAERPGKSMRRAGAERPGKSMRRAGAERPGKSMRRAGAERPGRSMRSDLENRTRE
jgi:cardiolipin synthase (CMP-forming)